MADFLLTVGVDVQPSYKQMAGQIRQLTNALNANPPKIKVEFDSNSLTTMRKQIENLYKTAGGQSLSHSTAEINKQTAAFQQNTQARKQNASAQQSNNNASKTALNDREKEIHALTRASKLHAQMTKNLTKWTAAQRGKSSGEYEIYNKQAQALDSLIGQLSRREIDLETFNQRMAAIRDTSDTAAAGIRRVGEDTKTLGQRLGGLANKFTTWFGLTRIIMAAYRAIRQMVTNVKELDTAMTELKKVTDETNATYNQFLDKASDRAKKLGSTMTDVVSASADFARLGFGLSDAEQLADAAIVYKNVGDGIEDINTASESIIATMQAFGVEASDVMSIVDKFNAIGNNYAISSGGVGDALLRSAAAMRAANNTLDETIALAAAANTIVQDPDKVGTTLKTVSMYLRAAKTEAEEAGESTDGMATSVSELRDEILALTGSKVDIMADDNSFKSTYQILKELSGVWHELTDVSQANILEMVGGKRNSNVVAAILENFKVANDALETSANSEGSALKENEKVLASIEGKINIFKATFEELSNTLIQGQFIKDVVDLGTNLLNILISVGKLVDKLGGLNTVLYTTAGILAIIKAESIAGLISSLWKTISRLGNDISGVFAIFKDGFVSAKAAGTSSLGAIGAGFKNITALASTAQLAVAGFIAVFTAFTLAQQSIEKTKEKTKEAAQESANQANESLNHALALLDLKKQLDEGTKSTEDLTEAFRLQLEQMGYTEKQIDTLIGKYDSLSGAINDTTYATLKKASEDAYANKSLAEQALVAAAQNDFKGNSIGFSWSSTGYDSLDKEIAKILSKTAKQTSQQFQLDGENLFGNWTAKSESAEDLYEYYQGMQQISALIQQTASELDDSSLLDLGSAVSGMGVNTIYGNVTSNINMLKESATAYADAINTLHQADARLELANYLKTNSIKTKEDLDAYIQSIRDNTAYSEEYKQVLIDTAQNSFPALSKAVEDTSKRLYDAFDDTIIGRRIQHLTELFNKGALSHKEYFDALQSEIDNFDASSFTDSMEDATKAAKQFFVDSVQQSASGLSGLIEAFDKGEMSISEYLEGYLSIGKALSKLTDALQDNSEAWNKNGDAIDNATNKSLDGTQSSMNDAISIIEGYQDSIYSLEQIMIGAVEVGSDEFTAHAQVIAQDLANIVASGGLMADEIARTLGTTTSEIAANLTANVANQEIAAQAIAANTNSAIQDMATAIGTLFDNLGQAISNFKVELSFGIKSIDWSSVEVLGHQLKLPAIKFELGASGESLKSIGDSIAAFGKSVSSNFVPQTIDINDFHFGNTENGKNRNYTPSSNITDNYNNALENIKEANKKANKEFSESFNWIDIAVKRLQRTITNLSDMVSSTWLSWTKRNAELKKQISAVNTELGLQNDAAKTYEALANGVTLDESYKRLVRNGALDISTITDEDLADKIKQYQEYYEASLDAYDAAQKARNELSSLAKQSFDNISKEYNDELALMEHLTNTFNTGIEKIEAQGYLASTKYYYAMRDVENENINAQKQELQQLVTAMSAAMNAGLIEKGSEDWYAMQQEINAVKEAIQQSELAVIEFGNSIREVEWGHFDYLQEQISNVTAEADFLIKLMENSDLYTDNGQLTDTGKATMGLHGQNYNVYMHQADEYAKEILAINELLAEDPNNTTLLERKEELLELQRESILSAEDEKQAIIDMVEEGINLELEALSDLIDKYKESLDSAKDLYDYQKKIKEQTSEIATLQKQLSAYRNDMSEENRAVVQKIEVNLAKAMETLEETQYERYISDTTKLLDNLYLEYETMLNSRLDDAEALMNDMITEINQSATDIASALNTEATEVGYTLSESMKSIWMPEGQAYTVITSYGEKFNTALTTVNSTLTTISTNVGKMIKESDKEADKTVDGATPTTEADPSVKPAVVQQVNPPTVQPTQTAAKAITVGGKINAGSARIYSTSSGGGGGTQYYKNDPIYTVLGEKNGYLKVRYHKLSSGVTGWFKKSDVKAYKTGGLVDYTGLAWVDGEKDKPESFLDSEDTANVMSLRDVLRDIADGHISLDSIFTGGKLDISETLGHTNVPDGIQGTTFGDVHYEINIPIDHVEDYNDFMNKMRNDDKFERFIQSMTVDRLVGRSKLEKSKFKW
ncbi:MAG: phage tail tape measure protein [Tyzzerella sp.]|nr:phage tail tape measure protein [Tyzzerella sp.]